MSRKSSSSRFLARAREVFDIEIEGLRRTRDSLDGSFDAAIGMMLDCARRDGIVVVTGVGKSLHAAEKISATLSSTGTRSIVLNPVQAMHGDLGMVSARDILLALSFSGESDEILRLVPAIRRHGLKIVSLTGNPGSSLATASDVHIAIPCGREACPFGMAPTNSVTATLAMGDALAMAMIDAQEFSVEDYAKNHPAGAIGRALVMRASDVMRTGERLARVSPETTVMATLFAMTTAKSGSAVVADEDGRLLGIFTDGDFRRFMSERGAEAGDGEKAAGPTGHPSQSSQSRLSRLSSSSSQSSPSRLLETPVGEVMTQSPLFVRDDAYAAELLKIFEKRRIDDLPVCNAEGRVVGLVDIQDLPKMKVM